MFKIQQLVELDAKDDDVWKGHDERRKRTQILRKDGQMRKC